MIIPKNMTVYVKGGKRFGPGSDCPDRLLTKEQKSKIEKGPRPSAAKSGDNQDNKK